VINSEKCWWVWHPWKQILKLLTTIIISSSNQCDFQCQVSTIYLKLVRSSLVPPLRLHCTQGMFTDILSSFFFCWPHCLLPFSVQKKLNIPTKNPSSYPKFELIALGANSMIFSIIIIIHKITVSSTLKIFDNMRIRSSLVPELHLIPNSSFIICANV